MIEDFIVVIGGFGVLVLLSIGFIAGWVSRLIWSKIGLNRDRHRA